MLTLVPSHPQPAQAVVDHVEKRFTVALFIRILDPQHKYAARVASIEPIEQGGAGTSDVEEPSGTWCEANAYLRHDYRLRLETDKEGQQVTTDERCQNLPILRSSQADRGV